jgi:hypothetical protein
LERYEYAGYGELRTFGTDLTERGSSAYGWRWLFQGRERGSLLGNYDFRARTLWPSLGRFGQEDPARSSQTVGLNAAFNANWPGGGDPYGLWFTPVHNQIIEAALSDKVHGSDLDILKRASRYVDDDQSVARSYKHAMRAPWELVFTAEREWHTFIQEQFDDSIRQIKSDVFIGSMFALGEGMHALMDGTSPRHRGFKPWYGFGKEGVRCPESDSLPWGLANYARVIAHAVIPGEFIANKYVRGKDFQEAVDLVRNYYLRFEPEADDYQWRLHTRKILGH